MLLRDDIKLAPLLEGITLQDMNIKLYKKRMQAQYYSWILCCSFFNSESLLVNWESIVNKTAIYVQAELESAIERYNLYIVFFVSGEVPIELKMQIEQDKYSSRKLVISEALPSLEQEIDEKIDKLLFTIKCADNKMNEEILLKDWLSEVDSNFYNLYLRYSDKPQQFSDFLSQYASSLQTEDGD